MTESINDLTLKIEESIEIGASQEQVFESVLHRLGAMNSNTGDAMPMTLEAKPGGRWFRDLGEGQGHLWAHVQVIKKPNVIELTGPLFMSYPAISHLRFRITPQGDTSLLTFTHQAFGMIQPDHRDGVKSGWKDFMQGVKDDATK